MSKSSQLPDAGREVERRLQLGRSYPSPQPPVFGSVEEERAHRKHKLAAAFRIFGKLGYDEGVMGHISARDPGEPETFWINPFGVSFNLITADDLMRVDLEGNVVEGEGYPHPGGIPLHSVILSLRPDIVSAAHTHSLYGRTWTTNGRSLPPASAESAVFFEKHGVYDSHAHGEGDKLVDALSGNRALLMKNHGLLTVGQSVDEAAYLFVSLEKICQSQIAAESIGSTQTMEPEQARRISNWFQPYHGWLNFQPLYQTILKEQPDLLDAYPSARSVS
ncbi:class II aldolase/adducin family protein [Pseudomonas sp. ABC1]|uniref:class II aldolase/adducin family protein n=1 Tax=Pseudomonas sp. ABC1 TaxID=2748080 RepID=UPI0015C30F62|nr:class II aldolase/adducin family protein [Pseudomonas sp. ABC1]QLF93978.1 class II aldolase/adducin family protein [Pseudomonas sp. ABC1]